MVHQHCGREQGLGPSCVVAPLGSVFPSLEGVPQLVQTVLVPVTCGGCYVLTSITACLVYFLSPYMFCNVSIQLLVFFIITFQQLHQSGICTDVLNFAMFSLA